MAYLESVRDRLREEYEERMEKLQEKKTLRVVEFQLQLMTSKYTAKGLIQEIDPSAPIPQALEGGDMKGPLVQCILHIDKFDMVQKYCEDNYKDIKIYSGCSSFDLEESLYRPDGYVSWQMGASPTVNF